VITTLQCHTCKHFRGYDVNLDKVTCEAFPGGIPYEIQSGFDHTEPFEGDKGIRWEQAELPKKGEKS
jgi:hypothetical protein